MFAFLSIMILSVSVISTIVHVDIKSQDKTVIFELPKTSMVDILQDLTRLLPTPFDSEQYGRPSEIATLSEFYDMWMELSEADKFFYSTECWRFDMVMAA